MGSLCWLPYFTTPSFPFGAFILVSSLKPLILWVCLCKFVLPVLLRLLTLHSELLSPDSTSAGQSLTPVLELTVLLPTLSSHCPSSTPCWLKPVAQINCPRRHLPVSPLSRWSLQFFPPLYRLSHFLPYSTYSPVPLRLPLVGGQPPFIRQPGTRLRSSHPLTAESATLPLVAPSISSPILTRPLPT